MAYTSNTITLPPNTGYTVTSGATVGGYLTSAGTATYSTAWTQPTTNLHDGSNTVMTIPADGKKVILEKKATLEINGNVVMNGMDLDERLKTIEKVLCIPHRDVTMEEKHPKLKQLYEQYMHELEKYKTWDRVKGDNDGTT